MRGVYCDGTAIHYREDLPLPQPLPGEVVLDVRAVGICDTDIQIARGYMGFLGILGHEFLGTDSQGLRYCAEINNTCQNCPDCANKRSNHCPHRTVMGILGHDGAMADRVCVPMRNLHRVPEQIDDREAVFVEPLAAAFRILEQVALGPGVRVAVLGDGKLGLLCSWTLALTGAEIHLVGKHEEKLALAGPSIVTHLVTAVPEPGREFEVVVEATGSPTGLESALRLVRPGGTVVLKTTVAAPHQIQLAPIVIDEVRVIGSRCGPFAPAIAALAERRIDVRPLIEAEYPLKQAEEAFRRAARPGARKVILRI